MSNTRNAAGSLIFRPMAIAAVIALAGFALFARQTTLAGAVCGEGVQPIQVIVENVRNSDGLITAVLYDDDAEKFLKKGQRVDRIRVAAQAGETLLCLKAPTKGHYAIALYHDENSNKKFDRNFLGIPDEGYGFSNNPGFRFGAPDHDETLFQVDGMATAVRISVLYL